jgi:uncharacterized heparinase superfamily protein
MRARIILIYNTVRHLKVIQILYFVYYAILKKTGQYGKVESKKAAPCEVKQLLSPVKMPVSFRQGNFFTFLNLTHHFDYNIDWNYNAYGKLWTYQLNYFEFLHQPGISKDEGLGLIKNFCRQKNNVHDGFEPYCISLRTIQWIKFLSLHAVNDANIRDLMWSQVHLLKRRIEFHIQANHLLENALALTAAGCYFRDKNLLVQSGKLLRKQLREQILRDGGHYERSPMYHLVLLNRMLDVINIMQHYREGNHVDMILNDLSQCAGKMAAWLNAIEVDGHLPAFQDSTNVVPFSIDDVRQYMMALKVDIPRLTLGASGYRVMENRANRLIIDVGSPFPAYQPGHAHAGALSWTLFHAGLPVVVDPGVSTYESNAARLREKGTNYHNTIQVGGQNQSEVWGAFRMGARAKTTINVETSHSIEAQHDGYSNLGIIHRRMVEISSEGFVITDRLLGKPSDSAVFIMHFHPDCLVTVQNGSIVVDNLSFTFDPPVEILLEPYYFAVDFNYTRESLRVVIPVRTTLRTTVIGKEKK